MQTYDIKVVFTNLKNLNKVLRWKTEINPIAFVIDAETHEKAGIDNRIVKQMTSIAIDANKANPTQIAEDVKKAAENVMPILSKEGGMTFCKIFGVEESPSNWLYIVDQNSGNQFISYELRKLREEVDFHNKKNEPNIKIKVQLRRTDLLTVDTVEEEDEDLPYVADPYRSQYGNYGGYGGYGNFSSEADFVDEPSDKNKFFKAKKAELLDRTKLLNIMTLEVKDVTVEFVLKALAAGAKYFNERTFYELIDSSITGRVGSRSKLLKDKTRNNAWIDLVDAFVEFLRYFYQEKREMVSARGNFDFYDENSSSKRSEISLPFKGKEISSLNIDRESLALISQHGPLMELLIQGFDLSKAVMIVEQQEKEDDMRYFSLMAKENKGEELKRYITKFLKEVITQPRHRLAFMIRLTNQITQKDPNRHANVARLIQYLHSTFIESHAHELKNVIENDDKLRDGYFRAIDSVIKIVASSPYRNEIDKVIDWMVTGSVLRETPNLPNEFYKILFSGRPPLTEKAYQDYFRNNLISSDSKADTMFFFLYHADGFPDELASLLENFVQNPNHIPNLSLDDLFRVLDTRYKFNAETLDQFIKRNKNCPLHKSILKAINKVMTIGYDTVSRRFLSTKPNSYFVRLYNSLVDFIKSCNDDLLIEYINVPEYLNSTLVTYLEQFKLDGGRRYQQVIDGYSNRLRLVKDNLNYYISVLEKNSQYMKIYQFFDPLLRKLLRFRSEINSFTMRGIESDKDYVNCSLLKEDIWNVYNICEEYVIYYNELRSRCTPDISFVDYKAKVDQYSLDLKNRLISFLNDKVYTLKQYQYHFPRIMFAENIKIYQEATAALGLTQAQRATLFAHSRAFHALGKVLKLKDPIDKILKFGFIKLKKSAFITKIEKIYQAFNATPADKITYESLEAADKPLNILVSNDYEKCKVYQLPMVIRYLADSPDTLKFMKDSGTDFIKSMRDEVDNENIDIINKLDVINKNVSFFVNDTSIDSILDQLTNIPKSEQRKVKGYIKSIEGLILTHIVHLADKTKMDTGYNKKTVMNILEKSLVIVNYNLEQRDYTVSVKYLIGATQLTVDPIELSEHFNKAKIIVNENQGNEAELDDFQLSMIEFNNLGKEVQGLLDSFKALRSLGLMNYRFNDLLKFLNDKAIAPIFETNAGDLSVQNSYAQLTIKIGRENQSIKQLHVVNEALEKLLEEKTTELYSYYSMDCYIFTYFFGKKLYYLIEFLRGRLNDEEAEECLNLISEAFPSNHIDFSVKYTIPEDITKVLEDVHTILTGWSQQVSAKQRIRLNNSRVFLLKKIVVVVNPVENKYMTMLKIMAEAQENIFSLSQVLFCRPETTRNEIFAFCKRALLDPFKRIYFCLNIHVLEYYLLLELRNFINKIIETEGENINYNLLIFADKTEYHKDLLENINFVSDSALESLETDVPDSSVRDKYAHVFTANQLIISTVAGMGKTSHILKKSKEYDLVDLFLSGELNKSTITKRLSNLSKQARDKNKLAINVKLDFIEDFSRFAELVDYTLFCVALVNRYYTEKGCRDLRGSLKLIFFEIGNTFGPELLMELHTLRIFNIDPEPEKDDLHKYRITVPAFMLEQTIYSADLNSNEQVAANFFELIESYDLSQKEKDDKKRNEMTKESILNKLVKDSMKVVPEPRFRQLVGKYFMLGKPADDKLGITYAQYQFWLKALTLLVREFDKVEALKPEVLDQQELPKEVRVEIAGEINLFAAQIINMSVNQAKTSQAEMKKILSSLSKEDIKSKRLEEYKTKFVNLEAWDSGDMLVPLVRQGRVLMAHTNMELFNKPGSLRHRQRINLKAYIRKNKTYFDHEKQTNSSDMYLKLLADFLGKDFEELKTKAKAFQGGKGFSITKENFMKICLIILKAELKTPIIMMGESGCGKTYVSQFVSKVLLDEELRELTLYSGVSEADFVNFMRSAVQRANEIKADNKRLWIFFDEFNTSCLQSIVAEIMLDRVCPIDLGIYHIPENIIFISCCNPYRMKTKKADVGLVPKTTDTLLSHRVYPIPERLINFIWDFGQLSDQDEFKHLQSIVEAEKIFDSDNHKDLIRFCNLIFTAHKFVRDIEERSGVSLRDIKRVLTVYKWFHKTLTFYQKEIQKKANENKKQIHLSASIAAIMVCYGLRLNGRPEQTEFILKIKSAANDASSLNSYAASSIRLMLSKIAQEHFDEIIALRAGVIPEGIALNTPLKENFITMLACFDTLTPLIICGAPGTSKTLCTQIFNSALQPNIIKTCKILSVYKGINPMYYGGSQTSTSEGISKVFKRGQKFLENKSEDRPVVVFDEIGLAELSPYNPLKILHPLLERIDIEVGFLGLSNWTLDLSKMNRLIYVARPDMTRDDLVEIFKISIAKCPNEEIKRDLEKFLSHLTSAYLRFRNWQKKHGNHPNFHGSRDIYGVSKYIYRHMSGIKHFHTTETAKDLIKSAIERNFNGAIYLFGINTENAIDPLTVPSLSDGLLERGNLLSMIRVKELGDVYSTQPDPMDAILVKSDGVHKGLAAHQTDLAIFNSTEVFKRIFLSEIHDEASKKIFSQDFLPEYPVLKLINENINDKAARFLMIKSEGEVIDNIFLEKLREFNKSDKIVDWRGIRGKENSIELLSTLKSYISLGYVVVMKNLDELYGSLYDLFNQKYIEVDNRQYCYLYYGENKHRVEVHPDFKAIVIIPSEKELEGLDVELEQPAPFLNRFEKFFLRISNILSPQKIEELIKLRNYFRQSVKGFSSRVVGLSVDMLTSMCVSKGDVAKSDHAPANSEKSSPKKMDEENVSDTIVSQKQRQLGMRLTSLNYLLNNDLSQDDIRDFLAEHPYSTLNDTLTDISQKSSYKVCLLTFSNPMELEPMRNELLKKHDVHFFSSEDMYAQGLERRSATIRNHKGPIFAMQFVYVEHLSMLSQIKSNIETNAKITKAILLIHLERDPRKRDILKTNIGLNYWNEWDNRILDNIHHTYYQEYTQIREMTFEQLLLTQSFATGIHLFKEACLLCIVKNAHDKLDASLRLNMFNIRSMLETDTSDTFINSLREKLKVLNIFNKDNRPWPQIISERNKGRDNYVDIDIELLNYFKEQYSDQVKNYLWTINTNLSNIASYSLGILSKDEQIKTYYLTNLKDKMEKIDLKSVQPLARKGLKGLGTFFRLPFLRDTYQTLLNSIKKNLMEENGIEFQRIVLYINKLKIARLYKVGAEQIEQLKFKIIKAENFLNQETFRVITPILKDIEVQLEGLISKPLIMQNLIFDLLSISTNSISITMTEEILENFKVICFLVNPDSSTDLKSLFATSCLLSIGLNNQMGFVFDIMSISNLNSKELEDACKTIASSTDGFKFNYTSLDSLINFCQERLIPKFDDPKLDLKATKEKYEQLIDRLLADKERHSQTDENLYNFRALINLFSLLAILPIQKRLNYQARLKDIKNEKQRFGTKSTLEFVHEEIMNIFFESSDIAEIDSQDYCLVLSEHIVASANMLKFNLFTENKYDQLFSRFSKDQIEKISCSLGSLIASKIPNFYSFENLKSALNETTVDHSLGAFNEMLNKIDLNKPRNLYFVVSLIDNLYIKGMCDRDRKFEDEFPLIIDFISANADFSKQYKSLKNIIFYTMTRLIFNPNVIKVRLLKEPTWITTVEELFKESSRSKEYFCNNPNSFVFEHFIQAIIRDFGDLGTYQPVFTCINNICTLILDEDVQGTITFWDKDLRDYFVILKDELDDANYKKEFNKVRAIFDRSYQGNKNLQLYLIGVVLINKFVNEVKDTDEAVIKNLKTSYINAFNQLNTNANYIELLKIIVDDNSLSISQFIGEDVDMQYKIRLRKTFLQFMLISILFKDGFGYDYNAWKDWQNKIELNTFKSKLVNTEKLNNACSVAENIIIERLSDGSYQDYGANLGKNLGIYRCSCMHIYSIGNCGYAVVKSLCPKCGKDIGGEGHNFTKREGHIHIDKLDDLFNMIKEEYYAHSGHYNLHTVVNHTSIELFPVKIIELGIEKLMKSRKLKANDPFWQIFYCNQFIRHLFDHMYLTILPETLSLENKKQYEGTVGKIIDYSTQQTKELYGRMSGKEIHNYVEYFLAHVKNDIGVLSHELHFGNPVDIFDWLRAVMSLITERMHHQKIDYTNIVENQILQETDVTEPGKLIIEQENCIQAMVETDVSTKSVVKNMFFRKIDGNALYKFMDSFKEEIDNIYKFSRHNKYSRQTVFESFNKQLESSEHVLLKKLVRYNNVLKDFPRMVKANLDLSYYLMNNYSRLYNFDEATDLDIMTLTDPKLKELYKEFCDVWEYIIPKHEDTNPEVFSFAFMCHRNLNVDKFIQRMKSEGGATFVNLVYVNPADYSSEDLLYMKSIMSTFIKYFHNMFIDHVNEVLGISEGARDNTTIEYCDESSFVSSVNYEPLVESNFWYNTETSKENDIYFDLKRIEYTVAKLLKKKYILFEEEHLKYYEFRNKNTKSDEILIENMLKKIEGYALDDHLKRAIDEMSADQLLKTYNFIFEIGEYIYQNFLFAEPDKYLKLIIQEIESAIVRRRFTSYDEKLHNKLKVGHLVEYYALIKERKFDLNFTENRSLYNKPLTTEQRANFENLINDNMVSGDDLEEIKIRTKDILRQYYNNAELLTMTIDAFGDDMSDIQPAAEFINKLIFSQYLEMATLLNDGIMIKNKVQFVRRTSSNLGGVTFEKKYSSGPFNQQ